MNRLVLISVTIAALAGASVLGWFEVRQTREFRRLIALGDAAVARDQTYAAIEAYSGAVTLRRDSMLGWLKRGDAYVFMINGAKVRAPAAALALQQRLR